MNYLIILFSLIPGYIWHIIYVRQVTRLTLPNSAWKLLLPLLFVSSIFLVLTFFLREYHFFPKCLNDFLEKFVFGLDVFKCSGTDNEQRITENLWDDCRRRIYVTKLFASSILFTMVFSILAYLVNWLVARFQKYLIKPRQKLEQLSEAFKGNLKQNQEHGVNLKKVSWVVNLITVSTWLMILNLFVGIPFYLLKFLRKSLEHIYLLDSREENRFLKSAINKTVLVSLKAKRVYVGTLVEADLRQDSDDDDALLLYLSLSGFRDSATGVLNYITSYRDYSPLKLLFMREVESISIYNDNVTDIFIEQRSVVYPTIPQRK